MFFNHYPSLYTMAIKLCRGKAQKPSTSEFYRRYDATVKNYRQAFLCLAEWQWWKAGRPYYNVWPGAEKCLLEFKPDRVELASLASASERTVAIQFPRNSQSGISSALISMFRPEESDMGCFSLVCSEVMADGRVGINLLHATEGATLEEDGEAMDGSPDISPIQRLAYAVLLMEHDPEFIEADILARDASRYEVAGEMERREIELTAEHIRGQRGWHLGRKWETVPHFRRPHPALVWTGPGRTVPKVVLRSGCIVKRQKMTEAPTGFHGSFGEADHDAE